MQAGLAAPAGNALPALSSLVKLNSLAPYSASWPGKPSTGQARPFWVPLEQVVMPVSLIPLALAEFKANKVNALRVKLLVFVMFFDKFSLV